MNRSHQVGCAALKLAEAPCTCPRTPRYDDYLDPLGFVAGGEDDVPWWLWAICLGAIGLITAAIYALLR